MLGPMLAMRSGAGAVKVLAVVAVLRLRSGVGVAGRCEMGVRARIGEQGLGCSPTRASARSGSSTCAWSSRTTSPAARRRTAVRRHMARRCRAYGGQATGRLCLELAALGPPVLSHLPALHAAFHARYPWVRDFNPWNEANHGSQPTYRHPRSRCRLLQRPTPRLPRLQRRSRRRARLVGHEAVAARVQTPPAWAPAALVDAQLLRRQPFCAGGGTRAPAGCCS